MEHTGPFFCNSLNRSLGRSVGGPRLATVVALFVVLTPLFTAAQTASNTGASFIARYQSRVSATQSQQPHWVTPLVTVTPRLEQEFRTDFVRQSVASSYRNWNYGNSKGLELIPERHTEVIFNVPPFISHGAPHSNDGFGDVSFLLKERIFARNEEHGNAIVTAFFGASIPTGKNGNGSCCAVVTPTLAIGKGFGLLALTTTARRFPARFECEGPWTYHRLEQCGAVPSGLPRCTKVSLARS
jgi:hypothetical protein